MSVPAVEWLEADGLGGFASGTSAGIRTRRYHGVLLVATTPPTGRVMLVNGFEAWVTDPAGARQAISSHRYAPGVTHPDGIARLADFSNDPWPRWTYRLEGGVEIEHELFVVHGSATTVATWRLRGEPAGRVLHVRPLLSGRDYHATHHENAAFRFDATWEGNSVTWRPYDGLPAVTALSNGRYVHAPDWYRTFLYEEERARGLDDVEDLASPGMLTFDLRGEAVLILTTAAAALHGSHADTLVGGYRSREQRRRVFQSPLHRGADAYLVQRGAGSTIIAGYPWFTDWGRDTFIALRGLCIAGGRLAEARQILLAWAGTVSEGMLPNRFPDRGDAPEFNSVDASLWYVIAVHDLFAAIGSRSRLTSVDRQTLRGAVEAIVQGYAQGTRYGIRMDADGLLACGEPCVQLTWMDSKIGDWVVTPRTGKPVEIQALWLNALRIAGRGNRRWRAVYERGVSSFRARFWNAEATSLFDVIDVDHRPGTADPSFRPNQILAVGGLPFGLLEPARAAHVVEAVERRLLTPIGLRSLAPDEPGYQGRYEGNAAARDARYHQGTVWPWLIGPFVEAWIRVRRSSPLARREARERFLAPLLALAEAGGGHLPEIADADPPHTPRGCPWQAWSVGEVLRVVTLTREETEGPPEGAEGAEGAEVTEGAEEAQRRNGGNGGERRRQVPAETN